jgi:NTE family protein
MKNKKKIGLALGSGGVRGLTHIGVIKVLQENNIKVDYIAGTSVGAWIGAHFALYQDIEALKEFTLGKKKEKIFSFLDASWSGGLIKGKKLEKMLNNWLNNANFEDLKVPLSVVATDLIKAEPVIFNSGSLAFAVRSSMAIPGYFKPIAWQDNILVDGGLTNPVPDDVVKQMGADIVISVNLNNFEIPIKFKKKEPSVTEVALRTNEIIQCYLTKNILGKSDIVIQPSLRECSSWKKYFTSSEGEKVVKIGEEAMSLALPELLKKIKA